MKVSVIIPVYGVAAFIERCAHSLFSQTLEDVEFIFVDDFTPDDSITILNQVLELFPARAAQTRILRHAKNLGLPAARNTGLSVAQGEYIYQCDSDDWVEPNILESLYTAATSVDADIAYCDFYLTFEKNERYMSNPSYQTADKMLREGFLGGLMKYNVWNKLVKRSLYSENRILFPDGHPMGEDMTMIRLAACADKVKHVPTALYHYVKLNETAYSQSFSARKLADIRYNVDLTTSFLQKRFNGMLEPELSFFKLSVKLPFLISDNKDLYRHWSEWYPEANPYVSANKAIPLRTRLLQVMAGRGQWWYVRLYYRFVYKLIYGKIYK